MKKTAARRAATHADHICTSVIVAVELRYASAKKGVSAMNLHDYEIVGINHNRVKKSCCVKLIADNLAEKSLYCDDVVSIRMEDFTHQNIVNRLIILDPNHENVEEAKRIFEWSTSLSDSASWLTLSAKERWVKEFLQSKLKVAVLEPSSGAQVAIICGAVSLRDY